jgi:hypothetical protein
MLPASTTNGRWQEKPKQGETRKTGNVSRKNLSSCPDFGYDERIDVERKKQ